MNAVRDRYVTGQAPDWCQPREPAQPPIVLSIQQFEDLKARWLALGSLATTGVLALGYGLVQLMGVL